MSPKVIFVVGDKFASFRSGKDSVLLFSEYVALVPADHATMEDSLFVPGQGLSEVEMQLLLSRVAGPNREFIEQLGLGKRCTNTHKTDERNILVTEPRAAGPNTFRAELVIDDDCTDLLDHVTGRHLPGMLLVEAARQMLIAVTEKHGIEGKTEVAFVINTVNASFSTFAFPLPTELVAHWERREGRHSSVHFAATVQVIQADRCVAEVHFEYATFRPVAIDRQERLRSLSFEAEARAQTASAFAAQTSGDAHPQLGDS